MSTSKDNEALKPISPGRFTRVAVHTAAGELEARLSEEGNWELRVRCEDDRAWRIACTGDLECGMLTGRPVVPLVEESVRLGPLVVDPAAHRATVNDVDVALRGKEFALLVALAAQPGRVFSKSELLKLVWGTEIVTRSRTLDGHASRLRIKLRRAGLPGMVVNTPGIGYRLCDAPTLLSSPAGSPADKAA